LAAEKRERDPTVLLIEMIGVEGELAVEHS
jgi:hypothetical protein